MARTCESPSASFETSNCSFLPPSVSLNLTSTGVPVQVFLVFELLKPSWPYSFWPQAKTFLSLVINME